MNPRRIIRAVALGAGLAACTPQQASEFVGWHRQDRNAANAWLASPEGQQSLTDPSIDVPAPERATSSTSSWTAGDCDSFTEELAAVGLPVDTFKRIAWRETRCDPNAWVVDHDDTGGALMGLNFKGSLAGYWRKACGATVDNIRGNVPLIMKCTAAAYRDAGLRPWKATAG